jgi:tetratricopeptide (TPR) repeat protein
MPRTVPSPPATLELGWMATGAAVFAARTAPLTGRDALRSKLWQALVASEHQSVVLRLDGPPGVGITALLDDDAQGSATVTRVPKSVHTNRPTTLWVFDEPTAPAVAFARTPPSTGLVILGRGPHIGEPIAVDPLPKPLRAALVRSMLPVQADVAGWIALRARGLPGATRTRLHRLMADGRLTLHGRRYGWTPDCRPAPTTTAIDDALHTARSEFDQAANEQAWSRLLDVQATNRLQLGGPQHTAWLDLVGMLADRLPRDVPLELLADPSQPTGPLPSADALYHRGRRALRRQQHDAAQELFERYLARVELPKERALGVWQLGAVAFGLGHHKQAHAHFVAARALLQDGSDPVRLAHTLLALSLVESNLGQFETALDWARQATTAFETVGKPRHRANIADFESTCYLWLGQLDLAEARARESLALYANDGSPNRLVPLLNLAAALHHQQRTALVREILDEVARRAGFEEPRLLGVVALYGALFAAEEAREHDWDTHWETFDDVWATGVGWHPATARMLADIREHVHQNGWLVRQTKLQDRLDQLRDRFGAEVLQRFGVLAPPQGAP